MRKPEAFQNPYVTLRPVAYVRGDGSSREDYGSSGVLGGGARVWIKDYRELAARSRSTVAFVEDIGIISLDPRCLARTDILNR